MVLGKRCAIGLVLTVICEGRGTPTSDSSKGAKVLAAWAADHPRGAHSQPNAAPREHAIASVAKPFAVKATRKVERQGSVLDDVAALRQAVNGAVAPVNRLESQKPIVQDAIRQSRLPSGSASTSASASAGAAVLERWTVEHAPKPAASKTFMPLLSASTTDSSPAGSVAVPKAVDRSARATRDIASDLANLRASADNWQKSQQPTRVQKIAAPVVNVHDVPALPTQSGLSGVGEGLLRRWSHTRAMKEMTSTQDESVNVSPMVHSMPVVSEPVRDIASDVEGVGAAMRQWQVSQHHTFGKPGAPVAQAAVAQQTSSAKVGAELLNHWSSNQARKSLDASVYAASASPRPLAAVTQAAAVSTENVLADVNDLHSSVSQWQGAAFHSALHAMSEGEEGVDKNSVPARAGSASVGAQQLQAWAHQHALAAMKKQAADIVENSPQPVVKVESFKSGADISSDRASLHAALHDWQASQQHELMSQGDASASVPSSVAARAGSSRSADGADLLKRWSEANAKKSSAKTVAEAPMPVQAQELEEPRVGAARPSQRSVADDLDDVHSAMTEWRDSARHFEFQHMALDVSSGQQQQLDVTQHSKISAAAGEQELDGWSQKKVQAARVARSAQPLMERAQAVETVTQAASLGAAPEDHVSAKSMSISKDLDALRQSFHEWQAPPVVQSVHAARAPKAAVSQQTALRGADVLSHWADAHKKS